MRTIAISMITGFLLFTYLTLSAEKIYCRKYSGAYKTYNITVIFFQTGKMFIEVEDKNGGGYFSTPGNYTVKKTKVDFFYRGLNRTFFTDTDGITASPYTFSIDEDYKTEIILREDKAFSSSCK